MKSRFSLLLIISVLIVAVLALPARAEKNAIETRANTQIMTASGLQWARTYGGDSGDQAYAIQATSDGGVVAAGYTLSFVTGWSDVWILKLNSDGTIEWQKTYGGTEQDYAKSILETSDGGFVVAGYTYSYFANDYDTWILKLDSNGTVEWQKAYGGTGWDEAHAIQETDDGGFVLAGYTRSFSTTLSDAWVLKLSSDGTIEWQKTYGRASWDRANAIDTTSDGGYIVAGHTDSVGTRNRDAWILKLNGNGMVEWQKTYELTNGDSFNKIQETSAGDFMVAGYTYDAGGFPDMWVLKLNSNGTIEWQKIYGGTQNDQANDMQITDDGGVVVAGYALSFTTDRADAWILKLDSSGIVEWQKTYGGTGFDQANAIHTTIDGGVVVAGGTTSFGGNTQFDTWVLKLDQNGRIDDCNLSSDTDIVGIDTTAVATDSAATILDSNASTTNNNVTVQDTTASTAQQCSSLPSGINLLQNGDFSQGETYWNFNDLANHSVIDGVLNAWDDDTTNAIWQDTFYSLPGGAPMTVSLDIGNTSSEVKKVMVVFHDTAWADDKKCLFYLPANTPMATYTLQAATTQIWESAFFAFWDLTGDNLPGLQLDNISVQYQPEANTTETVCNPPQAPANKNLIRNADFSQGETYWNFNDLANHNVSDGVLNAWDEDTTNAVWQDMFFALPGGAPVNVSVDLANTSNVPKEVMVVVHDRDWSDSRMCYYVLPANTSMATYGLQASINEAWESAFIAFWDLTGDGVPSIQFDNIDVQYQPNLNIGELNCILPQAPANTNLINNGNFDTGEALWQFLDLANHNVNNGVLTFWDDNTFNAVWQGTFYHAPAAAPLQATLDLGNTSSSAKDVVVVLHNSAMSEMIECAFTLPPKASLSTYTIQGLTHSYWDHVKFAVWDFTGDDLAAIQVDNVSVQYLPGLGVSETTCTKTAFWYQLPLSTILPTEYGLVSDAGRSAAVLYGGNLTGAPYEQQTWEFDGTNWTAVTPPQSPNATYGSAITYDDTQTILFGGSDSNDTPLAETWHYDGTTWAEADPNTAPPARTHARLITYNDLVYLFGGNDGPIHYNDLWTYNGITWQALSPAQTPPARTQHGFVPTPDGLLLFGGRDENGNALADTWLYTAGNWTQVTDSETPPARQAPAMLYDTRTSQVWLIGGIADDVVLSDIWVYETAVGWTQLPATTQLPSAAYHQAVLLDTSIVTVIDGETWLHK